MQSVILEWVQEQGKGVSGQTSAIQMRRAGMAEVTVMQHRRFLSCDQRPRALTELMPRRGLGEAGTETVCCAFAASPCI